MYIVHFQVFEKPLTRVYGGVIVNVIIDTCTYLDFQVSDGVSASFTERWPNFRKSAITTRFDSFRSPIHWP
jgi:hypothetical protein